MDSALAIVIGAAISLVASVAAPWVKSAVEERTARRREHRAALADAIGDLVRAVALHATDAVKNDISADGLVRLFDAEMKIGLLVTARDADVAKSAESITRAMMRAVDAGQMASVASTAAEAFPRWYRGEIEASKLLADVLVVTSAIPNRPSDVSIA